MEQTKDSNHARDRELISASAELTYHLIEEQTKWKKAIVIMLPLALGLIPIFCLTYLLENHCNENQVSMQKIIRIIKQFYIHKKGQG